MIKFGKVKSLMKIDRHMIIIKVLVTLIFLIFISTPVTGSYSETTNIIPIPVAIEHRNGFFVFSPSIRIIPEKDAEAEASKLIDFLAPAMGYKLQHAAIVQPNAQAIKLELDAQLSQFGDEGYILEVFTEKIRHGSG